MKEER